MDLFPEVASTEAVGARRSSLAGPMALQGRVLELCCEEPGEANQVQGQSQRVEAESWSRVEVTWEFDVGGRG